MLAAALVSALSALFGQHWFSPVLGIAVLVGFALLVRRVVRAVRLAAAPMGELIEASARVEAGELGTQVEERGPREVRALARAFNAMSTRLEETEASRRRLLADVSHELRTPLTVIQGNVEGILDGLYPADRAHLERILAETHQLERLIDDLRTLSMADAGALGLQREPTDLGALAADAVAAFEPQAATAGVSLVVEAEDDLPDLELDPLRMRQVITNLVANAVRHTPSGGRVTVSVAADGDRHVLSVADTGPGMDADAAAHAFDRFWRTADSPGAGLGLAIVRDLVTAHGGEVDLRTGVGQGTT
ncbi:MAG: sensor histidine kinase, partial [Candidatus Limnocylindria bacterium]